MKSSVILYIIAAVAHSALLTSGTPLPVTPQDVSASLNEQAVAAHHEVLPRDFPAKGQSASNPQLVRRGSYTASNPEPFAPMIKRMKASMKSLESGAPVEKAKLKEILDSVVHADYRLRTATSDEADLDDFRKTHWSLRSQLLSYITSQPKTDTDTSNMIVRIGEKICIPDLFPTRGQSKPTQNDINYAQEVLIQLRKKDRKWDLNDGSEARKKLKEGMYAAYVASGIKPTV